MWRMEDERLIFWRPSRGSFEPPDVTSMSQFSLRVASDDFVVLSGLQEELVLLGGSLALQSGL